MFLCILFQCLNSDGVPIRIDVSFQFKAFLNKMREIVLDFKDFDGYKDVLKYSGNHNTVMYAVF